MRLRLRNLKKEFSSLRGRVTAVDGLEFEVADGEFFVLLGPSGCGKSTALNLIAGLEKPTAGEVWFGEKVVASVEMRIFLPPKERNVAMVFQDYALYPHLSVFENIAFPLRIARFDRARMERAVRNTATRLDIQDLLAARPAELSGGQRQRVAIARAIVREPDVFLLDEPLSNLDARLRAQTRTELRSLQKSLGITTVYVTHDQVEALTLGDRIAVLKEGGVEQIGSPSELYDAPGNPFVAGFIGSPPMNILKASVSRESGYVRLSVGNLKLSILEEKMPSLENGGGEISCLLGIRPEHIEVSPVEEKGSHRATIQHVEPLGRDVIIHLSVGGFAISALARTGEYREEEEVYVRFDMTRLHIFPPE